MGCGLEKYLYYFTEEVIKFIIRWKNRSREINRLKRELRLFESRGGRDVG